MHYNSKQFFQFLFFEISRFLLKLTFFLWKTTIVLFNSAYFQGERAVKIEFDTLICYMLTCFIFSFIKKRTTETKNIVELIMNHNLLFVYVSLTIFTFENNKFIEIIHSIVTCCNYVEIGREKSEAEEK